MSLISLTPLSDIRRAVVQENDGEAAAAGVMMLVVDAATQRMMNNYLDRVAIPYTVRCVTNDILGFIRHAFVGQDAGHVVSEAWSSGAHPSRVVIDTWARGAVEVKQKPPPPAASQLQLQVPEGATQRSGRRVQHTVSTNKLHTGRESLDRTRSTLEEVRSRTGSIMPSATNSTLKLPSKKSRRDLLGTDSPSLASGANGPVDSAVVSGEDAEYTALVKAEQKRKLEAKQTAERIAKQFEELKNVKDVIVDGANGRVIPVRPFDAKGAQARKAEPKFFVPPAVGEVEPAPPKERLGAPRKSQAASTLVGGGAKRQRRDGDFVQEENTHGPMVEGVLPSGGVTVKEGDITRRGDLKIPKTKLTRAEYKKVVDVHFQPSSIDPDRDAPDADAPHGEPSSPVSSPALVKPAVTTPTPALVEHSVRTTLAEPKAEFKTQKVAALPSGGKGAHGAHSHSPGKAMQLKEAAKAMAVKVEAVRHLNEAPKPALHTVNPDVLEQGFGED